MRRISRALVGSGVAVALGAFALTASGPATAEPAAKRATTTIEIDGQGRNLDFYGPTTVRHGQRLKVVNLTRPNRIGPHTFSLVKRSQLPITREEQKKCYDGPKRICIRIARAHEVDFEYGKVGKPLVKAGKRGWDKPFGKVGKGDSWFTQEHNESKSQRVSAAAGKRLFFLCAIHPNMQGKIRVTGNG